MENEILDLVNKRRSTYAGCVPLLTKVEEGKSLQEAANIRAIEITYLYDHIRPNGERAITSLYPYAHTDGENLGMGYKTAEAVCNAWFGSPTHDRNIINNSYHCIGISVFCKKKENGKYSNHFSQLFSTLTSY